MTVQDDDGQDSGTDDLDAMFRDENYQREVAWGLDAGGQRLGLLSDQNPWHGSGTVPTALAPSTERPLARLLWRRMLADGLLRWHVIVGPRRVGKTTVLYQTVARLLGAGIEPGRIWWLRLDHPLLMDATLGDLVRSVIASVPEVSPERPVFLFLDEVTYADDWDLWLKTFHDERWPVRIAATSSASAALRRRRQDSGLGRWSDISLAPCLLSEAAELIERPTPQDTELIAGPTSTSAESAARPVPQATELIARPTSGSAASVPRSAAEPERRMLGPVSLAEELRRLEDGARPEPSMRETRRLLMLVGGFPELLMQSAGWSLPDEDDAHRGDSTGDLIAAQQSLREDSVERAVYKDIPQAFQIDNPMMLERLMYLLAGQVAQLLSPSNIAKDLRLSEATIERYLAYLEAAFIVFTLPNYAGSEAKVQRRGRKLYFVDSAVRNAVLQRGVAPPQHPGEVGHLIENMAAAALHALASQAGVRLHHWREGRDEVDLIYGEPSAPLAFEVSSGALHDLSGLKALIRRDDRFRDHAYLVAPGLPVAHPADSADGIGTLPLDTLLMTIGRLTEAALTARMGGTA